MILIAFKIQLETVPTSDYGTALKLGKGAEVTGYVPLVLIPTTRNALTVLQWHDYI